MKILAMILALAFLGGYPLQAQKVEVSEEYVLRAWDINDGLPYNHVSSIAQTPDGYLWLTTWWAGLVRFDGVGFVQVGSVLNQNNSGALPEHAQTLLTAQDGSLWVGLDRGALVRRVGSRFETLVAPGAQAHSEEVINSIVEDSSGGIWFATGATRKVFRWAQGKLTQMPSPPQEAGHVVLHTDAKGRVWFSSKSLCGVYESDKVRVIGHGALGGRLAPAPGGGIWAAMDSQLVRFEADGKMEVLCDLPWDDVGGGVNLLYSDPEGTLWIGTRSHGLIRYRDGRFVKVPTSHSAILSLIEDREGNLWVGTEGGLNRLHSSAFSLRQTKDGLSHDSIVSLCEDDEEKLWVVGVDGRPSRSLDSSHHRFDAPPRWGEGGGQGAVMTVCADPFGGVWVGILGELVHWQNGVSTRSQLHENITALLPAGSDLWISTTQGALIRRNQEGRFENMPTAGGLVSPRALALDNAGRIWVGTESGRVFRQEADRFNPVSLPNARPGGITRFIVGEASGTVWIGAFRNGLYRYKNGYLTQLPQDAGLPVGDLRCLLIAPEDDFWFGTGRGLFRVTRQELEAVLDGAKHSLHPIAYGRNEGVPGAEYSFGFRNATARTHDGHLWFATYSGALELSPEKLPRPVKPVPIVIESVQAGESTPLIPDGPLVLPPRTGPVQIRYTQPQMSAPEQIQFRYRLLEDGEGDWIDAGPQRKAVFPRLYAGNYRFEVQASDSSGQWSTQAATLAITVRAAWWETGWFRGIGALLTALGFALLVRFVVKRRMQARIRKLEAAHALERERSRIARDMHDELGAGLTRIALMTELAADEPQLPRETAEQLEAVSDAARSVVRTLDEIVWTINPRNDTLDRLVGFVSESTRTFLSLTPVRLELELPPSIPASPVSSDARHHVILAVKEAVNNAVKYAEASLIRMHVSLANGALEIIISDNGKGFDPAAVSDSSNGLRNSRERMAAIGGAYSIESRPGAGTSVTLKLPLSKLPS